MTVLRYSSDAWGQSVLEGVSWDMLGVFFFVTVIAIVVHALYMWRIGQSK